MIDLQTVLTYLTLISVPVGVFYHIMTLRNSRRNQQLQLETRQAQLYMGLINTFNNLEFRTQWHLAESATWKDYDDFVEKYSLGSEVLTATVMMLTFFDSIGSLVSKGLIDIGLVDGVLAQALVVTWRMFESIIIGNRERFQTPKMWEDFEYVYHELCKRDQYAHTTPHK